MATADEVRQFIRDQYIEPAKQRGESQVQIMSGDVHSLMNLNSRMPLVCEVLRGEKLHSMCNITLIEEKRRQNVKNNSSTNIFIYDFTQNNSIKEPLQSSFVFLESQKTPHIKSAIHNKPNEVDSQKNKGTAKYVSLIVKTSLQSNNLSDAYKFATDLKNCTNGEVNSLVQTLISQIESRMEYRCEEIPIELIELADLINHKILFEYNK